MTNETQPEDLCQHDPGSVGKDNSYDPETWKKYYSDLVKGKHYLTPKDKTWLNNIYNGIDNPELSCQDLVSAGK